MRGKGQGEDVVGSGSVSAGITPIFEIHDEKEHGEAIKHAGVLTSKLSRLETTHYCTYYHKQ